MQQTLTDTILSISYLLIWILTFCWYHLKVKEIDAGSFIIFMYIIYAIFSVLTINDPLFSMGFERLKLFPYIYLYVMMIIALSPIINFHFHHADIIKEENSKILNILAYIIITSAILTIPSVMTQASNGILNLFVEETAGKDAYMDQIDKAQDSGSTIRNLPAVIFNSLADIRVFLFYYFLTTKQKRQKFIIIGLAFSLCIGIIIPILYGQRGGVVTGLLTIIGAYYLFKSYLSKRINKIIQKIGIILVVTMSLPIAAITMSRFGQENAGVGGFVNWYVGQGTLYFNNYGLNPGGTRNGDRTLNLFKRVIDSSTPKNYFERRDKYHNLDLDDNLFSTFVGDFTIDFGPIMTVLIFCVAFYILYRKTKIYNREIKLYQLLLLFFTVNISTQGGMTLFSYSDTDNIRIVVIIALYAYLRYHEKLLERFPTITQN